MTQLLSDSLSKGSENETPTLAKVAKLAKVRYAEAKFSNFSKFSKPLCLKNAVG
jgi:hypothetical protein